jgi:hypothetical protein
MSIFFAPVIPGGNNTQVQYNNNGVFDGVANVTNVTLTRLLESEMIRTNGSYSIGTPGTVPFGVGPIAATGMDLAPIGPDQYNVIDIRSGSFC